ncbi:MAG: flagellar hook-basal body complex protein FliE [Desulfovibrio sp.]|jgi:flagellar hook-basal body complex protein FliE|nr:flagellar hook-basal body complex protein FliE [Desulfovibrio sp.]
MSIQAVGLKAYSNALGNFTKAEQATRATAAPTASGVQAKSFTNTLSESLTKVNDMQTEKANMIQAFASGETQNVHELMITLQKAGLAVNMTSAVRNKVMEAYKELSRIQF